MSALVVAGIAVGIAAVGAWAGAAWVRRRRRDVVDVLDPPALTQGVVEQTVFGIQIGDVVLLGDRDVWVVGAAVVKEGSTEVAGIFFPPNLDDGVLFVRARSPEVLHALRQSEVEWGDRPPSTVEVQGKPFSRIRRIPVEISWIGDKVVELGPQGMLLEFEAPDGDLLLAYQSERITRCWVGRSPTQGESMNLGGGSATLGRD